MAEKKLQIQQFFSIHSFLIVDIFHSFFVFSVCFIGKIENHKMFMIYIFLENGCFFLFPLPKRKRSWDLSIVKKKRNKTKKKSQNRHSKTPNIHHHHHHCHHHRRRLFCGIFFRFQWPFWKQNGNLFLWVYWTHTHNSFFFTFFFVKQNEAKQEKKTQFNPNRQFDDDKLVVVCVIHTRFGENEKTYKKNKLEKKFQQQHPILDTIYHLEKKKEFDMAWFHIRKTRNGTI